MESERIPYPPNLHIKFRFSLPKLQREKKRFFFHTLHDHANGLLCTGQKLSLDRLVAVSGILDDDDRTCSRYRDHGLLAHSRPSRNGQPCA